MHATASQAVGFIGGAITTCGGVPQVIRMVRTKQTADLSWGMVALWTVGLSLSMGYGIVEQQPPIYVTSFASLCMTGIMIGLKVKYEIWQPYLQNGDGELQELVIPTQPSIPLSTSASISPSFSFSFPQKDKNSSLSLI